MRDKQRLVHQFLREARIAASVHHRNVINIVDFGSTEGQQPFMVMELLEGETLGARLHREPPLPLTEALQIAVLTLRGLTAVHEAGIIHRDLKPDNVFLARDRKGAVFPKILDFGISRSVEPRSGRRSALTTREGMIVGTPEYMSPEQARGMREIDRRSDIYSMGAILYEALTGRLAFANENVGDLIIQIVTGALKPVHEVNPKIPRAISDVVSKAMARVAADRFQDTPSMQQALIDAAQSSLGALPPTLSEMPPMPIPTHSGEVKVERARTFEFNLDAQTQAVTAAPPPAVESFPPPPRVPDDALRQPVMGRRLMMAGAALLVVGAAALLALRPSARWTESATARVSPAALPPAAEPEAASAQQPIQVELRGVPLGALITVDGAPEPGPSLELPRDGRNRVIRVSAAGKAPWQAVHHASASATYDVFLADSEPVHRLAANPTHAPASSHAKTHKKPPSALKRLDF